MGFEMTGLSYDPSRKLNKMQKFKQVKNGEDGKVLNLIILLFRTTLIIL